MGYSLEPSETVQDRPELYRFGAGYSLEPSETVLDRPEQDTDLPTLAAGSWA